MENRKIKVLHIVKDEKFFDGVLKAFEQDKRFENRSILVVTHSNYKFSYIKQVEKVDLIWNKRMLKECLLSSVYDVIFFHSLYTDKYKFFKYIPKEKIVIWWSWGFELYSSTYGMRQLITQELYKPETRRLIESIQKKTPGSLLKDIVRFCFLNPYYKTLRKKVIERIDYFQPVIPLEYQLMQKVNGFHAKEFYYPRAFTSYQPNKEHVLPADGSILLGNSTSSNNNHIDVWNIVKTQINKHQEVIIPFSYGTEIKYTESVYRKINRENPNVLFLRSFMAPEDYFKLINNCSYAVFGVMRQQAMGNINYCLSRGVKVFLYRDSLVYRFLKEWGYVVFAIEDINSNSFSIPLNLAELRQNSLAFEKQKKYVEKIRLKAISEIVNTVDNF